LYLHPPVLKACCRVINEPFRLSTRPGLPAQNLDVDVERDAHGWTMVGFLFMVDEFRDDNGATRFVPGSHLWSAVPPEWRQPASLARSTERSFSDLQWTPDRSTPGPRRPPSGSPACVDRWRSDRKCLPAPQSSHRVLNAKVEFGQGAREPNEAPTRLTPSRRLPFGTFGC